MSPGEVLPARTSSAGALPYAAVALAAMSWGTWGVIARKALTFGPMPASLQSAIVMAVVAVVCGAVLAAERRWPGRPARPAAGARGPAEAERGGRAWVLVAWFGASDLLNMLLFFAAYRLTIAVAVLTHYMTPVFVAMAAPLVLRERMTGRTALAILASFGGLAVMLGPGVSNGAASGGALARSAALGLASALFYASNVLVNKFIVRAFSATEALFWHGAVGAALGFALVPAADWAAVDPRGVAFLALAAVGPGALGGLAFVWGLRRMPAAHASTLTLLEPVVSVLLGACLLGERVGPRAVAGGALVLVGAVAVMTQRPAARPGPPSTVT
ncbi:MAG: DMT family transporter [Myxococcales bacterium]|nr:DMT family transporter [Myxococcales bacterium]